jgi:hypothetical protein
MREFIIKLIAVLPLLFSLSAYTENAAPHFSHDSSVALNAYRGLVEEHVDGIVRELNLILKTAVKENENGADTRKHAGF